MPYNYVTPYQQPPSDGRNTFGRVEPRRDEQRLDRPLVDDAIVVRENA